MTATAVLDTRSNGTRPATTTRILLVQRGPDAAGTIARARTATGHQTRSTFDSHGYARLHLPEGPADIIIGRTAHSIRMPDRDANLDRLNSRADDPLTDDDRSYLTYWRLDHHAKFTAGRDDPDGLGRWLHHSPIGATAADLSASLYDLTKSPSTDAMTFSPQFPAIDGVEGLGVGDDGIMVDTPVVVAADAQGLVAVSIIPTTQTAGGTRDGETGRGVGYRASVGTGEYIDFDKDTGSETLHGIVLSRTNLAGLTGDARGIVYAQDRAILTEGDHITITSDDTARTITITGTAAGAASFADLTGQAADSQIPASIARDTELPANASTSARGIVELATNSEAATGTDTDRAMTPSRTRHVTGAQVSSAERTAGTATSVRRFSPADVASMIGTHGGTGGGGGPVLSGVDDPTSSEGPDGGTYLQVTETDGRLVAVWSRADAAGSWEQVAEAAQIVHPDSNGALPDAAKHQGWWAVTNAGLEKSVLIDDGTKSVTFKDYGPDRVVLSGEPARASNEDHYQGTVAQPPHSTIANFAVNDILWDWGGQVWILKSSSSATRWATYSGPFGWHSGSIYYDEADAVHHVNATGRVVIIGQGNAQVAKISTAYTAPGAVVWGWVPTGITLATLATKADTDLSNVDSDLTDDEKSAIRTKIGAGTGSGGGGASSFSDLSGTAAISQGGTGATTAADARTALSVAEDNLSNLDAALSNSEKSTIQDRLGVTDEIDDLATQKADTNLSNVDDDLNSSAQATILARIGALGRAGAPAYSSTGSYSRGSIVTHTNGLFVYISGTARTASHDPDTQPGYWLRLSEGMAYEVITSGSHRIAARTVIVDGNTDAVYLCTTTQTTPRDLAHIAAQAASTGGTFIRLNTALPATVTESEAEAGTGTDTRLWTPQRVAEAIAALAPAGGGGGDSTGLGADAVAFSAPMTVADQTSSTSPSSTVGDQVLHVTAASTDVNMGDFVIATTGTGAAARSTVAVPEDGLYMVSCGVEYTPGGSSNNRRMAATARLVVNDPGTGSGEAEYYGSTSYFRLGGLTETPTVTAGALMELDEDDTITVYIIADGQEAAQTYTLQTEGSHFSIFKVQGPGVGHPAGQANDDSITGGTDEFVVTSIDVPSSGTWGFVNAGDIGSQRSGLWHRFLLADLTGRTDVSAGTAPSDANALMFPLDSSAVFYLGQTSGDMVAVAASDSTKLPANLRVRTT